MASEVEKPKYSVTEVIRDMAEEIKKCHMQVRDPVE